MNNSDLLDYLNAEHKRIHSALRTRRTKEALALPPAGLNWQSVEGVTGLPLEPRRTFSQFVAGECNLLAITEAHRCALALHPIYNPLFLYGETGLGKTHLLQAIAHAASEVGRRVLYCPAQRALYGPLLGPSWLPDVHILAMDDFQFIRGNRAIEIGLLVGSFLESGRQLVIAADRPPGDLEGLEQRVRSRLRSGLCIEIGSLDEALRLKILEARIADARQAHPTFEVPAKVVAYLASVIKTNGRDLDGAVNRLLTRFLMGCAISIEIADISVRDLVQTKNQKKVKIAAIQELVANHFNVSLVDILSARRTASVVRPRQIAMYLAKTLTLRSLPEIGRLFGGRDHTTVLHAARKIDGLIETNKALAEEIGRLREMLLS